MHLLSSNRFAALTSLQSYKCLFKCEIFKNHPRKRIFSNVSLSYLEKALQRNLRTDNLNVHQQKFSCYCLARHKYLKNTYIVLRIWYIQACILEKVDGKTKTLELNTNGFWSLLKCLNLTLCQLLNTLMT